MEFIDKVFIYGNNKKNQKILDQVDYIEYVGAAETLKTFNMINMGGYPGIYYKSDKGYKVLGDLYSVTKNQLKHLDQLKGEGIFFDRILEEIYIIRKTPRKNGALVKAWVYILQEIPPTYDYSSITLTTKNLLTYERI